MAEDLHLHIMIDTQGAIHVCPSGCDEVGVKTLAGRRRVLATALVDKLASVA